MGYPEKYEVYHSSEWHEVSLSQYLNWSGMKRVLVDTRVKKKKVNRQNGLKRKAVGLVFKMRGY